MRVIFTCLHSMISSCLQGLHFHNPVYNMYAGMYMILPDLTRMQSLNHTKNLSYGVAFVPGKLKWLAKNNRSLPQRGVKEF